MRDPSGPVGFIHSGSLSPEQRAALDWLRDRGVEAEPVPFDDIADLKRFETAWWHRDGTGNPDALSGAVPSAIETHLHSGGGLLLTLRGMASVSRLGVDPVAPDVTEAVGVAEPTGVLWRTLYDDHPAVAWTEDRRIPVCDRGHAPVARYESVVPANGEVLAGTHRGGHDVPSEMTVVSWNAGDGSVIGIGAPLLFGEHLPDDLTANRDRLTVGCLRGLAGGTDQPDRPKTTHELRRTRARLAGDPTRPQYHITPPANWLNDPNGLIEWNGRYHVFYQYNPAGPFHNTIHWGHAVSDDLVRWRDEPVALSPSPNGPDRDGCWTGCAVDDDGTPTIVYTGGNGREQLPCLATSDDGRLREWTKHEGNPVIEEPPSDLPILETEHWAAEFRDHSVWQEGDTWYQLVGTGFEDAGGAVLLYSSPDLYDWQYEGPLLVGEDGAGTVWECPELLDLGDSHLLHVSNYEDTIYFLGTLRDGQFEVDRRGILDHGDFYAPQSLREDGRHLTWGWLPETREVGAQWDAGWSGALSLPRVLTTGPDGRLRQRPASDVTDLRDEHRSERVSLVLDDERRSLDASGRALELQLEVTLADASAFELAVFESPDCEERTPVRYTRAGELLVERDASSTDPRTTDEPQRMQVTPYDEPLSLRAFLDGSVLELYANDRHCLTSRVYPTRADSTGMSVAAEGGRARVRDLSVWRLGSAYDTDGTADGYR